MGIKAPLQNAQPAGAKFPPNILISPINGDDIVCAPPYFKTAFFYCTVRLTVLVAVKPGLPAVMVTAEVPAGVPWYVFVFGDTPQPIIATSATTSTWQIVSFTPAFLTFLPNQT